MLLLLNYYTPGLKLWGKKVFNDSENGSHLY